RQGVLRQGDGQLGPRARRAITSDRTGQAEPERLHRVVQRAPARRMPQRALVPQPAARTRRDRTLAAGIQRGATEEGVGRADTHRLCEAVKVSPDSKPSRYSKRGDVGTGRMIHAALEEQAVDWGLASLYLESTDLACSFYEAMGYTSNGNPVQKFGALQCFPYSKQLQPNKSMRTREKPRAAYLQH